MRHRQSSMLAVLRGDYFGGLPLVPAKRHRQKSRRAVRRSASAIDHPGRRLTAAIREVIIFEAGRLDKPIGLPAVVFSWPFHHDLKTSSRLPQFVLLARVVRSKLILLGVQQFWTTDRRWHQMVIKLRSSRSRARRTTAQTPVIGSSQQQAHCGACSSSNQNT